MRASDDDDNPNRAWIEARRRLEIKRGIARANELSAKAKAIESGIGNVTEDPCLVGSLVSVFRQLEQIGTNRNAER